MKDYPYADTATPKELQPGVHYLRGLNQAQTLVWLRSELQGRWGVRLAGSPSEGPVRTIVRHAQHLGLAERNKIVQAVLDLLTEWKNTPDLWSQKASIALFRLPAGMPKGLQIYDAKEPLKAIALHADFRSLKPLVRSAILSTIGSLSNKEFDALFWTTLRHGSDDMVKRAHLVLVRIEAVTVPDFM